MRSIRARRAARPGPWLAAAVVAVVVLFAAAAAALCAVRRSVPTPPPPVVAPLAPPEVRDTAANLELAFANEVNAKEGYTAAARQADMEGFPGIARLFRACARAEQVHAERHVQAIAWTSGAEARANLQRPSVLTTFDNLKNALDHETYEVAEFYPPLIARARAEHRSMAVRSFGFARSAEREHVRLLEAAIGSFGQPAKANSYYVCPYCGKTIEAIGFRKCPNCFTPAGKFIHVT